MKMSYNSIVIIASALLTIIAFASCVRGQPSNIEIEKNNKNNATYEITIKFDWPIDKKLNKTDLSNYLRKFGVHEGSSSVAEGSSTGKLNPATPSSTPKGHSTVQTIDESKDNNHASQNIINTTANKKSTPIKVNTEAITPNTNTSTTSSATTKNESSKEPSIAAESKSTTESSISAKIETTTKSSASSDTTMNMSNRTHLSNKTLHGPRNTNSVLSGILVTITVVVFLVAGIWIYRKYTSTRFRTTTNNYHLLR